MTSDSHTLGIALAILVSIAALTVAALTARRQVIQPSEVPATDEPIGGFA